MEELSPEIKKGLEAKLEAMLKRELYTKYKTAPTEKEREQLFLCEMGQKQNSPWDLMLLAGQCIQEIHF